MSTLSDKSYRDFGVDLLKTVAMLMVVATHILTWGGFGLSSPPADNFWTQFLSESSVIKCVLVLVIVPVLILVVCILIDKLRKTLFSLGSKIFSKVINHD